MNEPINDIQGRRAVILIEIDRLKSETTYLSNISDQIHQLEQDYNALVDKEEELTPSPFSDPLRVFPPELWTSLIPNDVDELLNLTMVSSHWSQALLSLPALWTTVILDSTKQDYLSKAMTCIHLSRPMEFTLRIEVLLEIWQDIAPLILEQGHRVCRLSMGLPIWQEFITPYDKFRFFPALKYLEPPVAYEWSSDSPSGEFFPRRHIWEPMKASNFQYFPSLLDASGFTITPEILEYPNIAQVERVRIRRLDQETATTLTALRSIKNLHLDEKDDQSVSSTEPVCSTLLRVISLQYYGWNFLRVLEYMGNNLVKVDATIYIQDVSPLLRRLARFAVLRELSLDVVQASRIPVVQDTADTSEIHSIKYLSLSFRSRQFPSSDDANVAQVIRDDLARRSELFTSIFSLLALKIALVEDARIHGEFMTEPALRYIRGLRQLKQLSLLPRTTGTTGLTLEAQRLIFPLYELPTLFVDQVQHSSLLKLTIGNMNPMESRKSDVYSEQPLPRYQLSRNQIPSVIALELGIEGPLLFDISVFPNITSIDLNVLLGGTSASDFFEELILQPGRLPCLERIGLWGKFIEWDMLILMLERRNLGAQRNIKRIRSLDLHATLPYKLSYPISQLLKGKFPERPPLSEFSIDEIGKRLFDPTFSGCRSCIRIFRMCNSPTIVYSYQGSVFNSYSRLTAQYEHPFERLSPDPPLSPSASEWLKGKRGRRLNFIESYLKSEQEFYRESLHRS